MVKISILLPVKNEEKYLAACIHSIQEQRYGDWELLIVDDNSSDRTFEIAKSACIEDERIQYQLNKGNGIITALHTALKMAQGEYITRMDGDDLMPPDRLQLMLDAIVNTDDKTIVTGKVKYVSDQSVSEGYQQYQTWINKRIDQKDHWDWIYRECVIASPNWLIRRKDLMDIGGFDGLSYPEDYDLVLKWYQQGFEVKGLVETTLQWREHPERTSRNSDHYNQNSFFQLKIKHFLEYEVKGDTLVLWGTGTKGKLTASILKANSHDFIWMDMLKDREQKYLMGQEILNYRALSSYEKPKLLIAVYPPEKELNAMHNYLAELGLEMGKNYWFL